MTELKPRYGGSYIRITEQILFHEDKNIYFLLLTDQITDLDELIFRFPQRLFEIFFQYLKDILDQPEPDSDDYFVADYIVDACREINLTSKSYIDSSI